MANVYDPLSVTDTHKKYGGSGTFGDRAQTYAALGLGTAASYIGSGAQNAALRDKMNEIGGLTLPVASAPAPAAAPAPTAPAAAAQTTPAAPASDVAPAPASDVAPAPETDTRIEDAIARLSEMDFTPSDEVKALKQQVNDAIAAVKNQNFQYAQQLESSLQRILNPEKFEYDFATDPRYIAMKDEYIRNGRLAMLDTGAAAAAANGGRETSYGRAAAQQAYQNHVAGLNDIIPELEQSAYARYRDSLSDESDRYQILAGERDRERDNAVEDLNLALQLYNNASDEELNLYGLKRDALRDVIDLLIERSDTAYERAWNEEGRRYDRERDSIADTRYEREYADERSDTAYKNLASVISASGYDPTDAELADAGMTRGQANALKTAYQLGLKSSSSSGGGSGDGSKKSSFNAADALKIWNNEAKGLDLNTADGMAEAAARFAQNYDDADSEAVFEWMKGRKQNGHTYYDWLYYNEYGKFPDSEKTPGGTTPTKRYASAANGQRAMVL